MSAMDDLAKIASTAAIAGGSPVGALAATVYGVGQVTEQAVNPNKAPEETLANCSMPGGRERFCAAARDEGLV